jgi:DNA-binding MarR family transcriptional regulator
MQKMQVANMLTTPERSAEALLDTVPLVMRTIRQLMREQRSADLSVPQFRALGFVHRHPETSVSAVAEHLGLSAAATSRLVDALVERGLVERQVSAVDRRFVTLRLSPEGITVRENARRYTAEQMAAKVSELSDADRATVVAALESLRRVFGGASFEPEPAMDDQADTRASGDQEVGGEGNS